MLTPFLMIIFSFQYCLLANQNSLDNNDEMKRNFITLNGSWDDLHENIEAVMKRLRHSRQMYSAFFENREKEIIWMRALDGKLTGILVFCFLRYKNFDVQSWGLQVFHERVFPQNGETRFSQKYFPECILPPKKSALC